MIKFFEIPGDEEEAARQADGQLGRETAFYCACGEPITEARRRATPGAQTCSACVSGVATRACADWGMAE